MAIKKDYTEKRRHKRFNVKEGIFAVSSPDHDRLGQIKDVSKGGLAFQYLETIQSYKEPIEVEIFSPFEDLSVKVLPVRSVRDFKIVTDKKYNTLPIRQTCLQFQNLNHSQELLLDKFIRIYSQP